MDQNPYQAPQAMALPVEAGPDAPRYELYSPQQVGLAAFLGAPIAACWFIAHNYRNLGNRQASSLWLLGGMIATVALLAICFYLPDGFPNQLIPITYVFALLYATRKLQGEAVARHLTAGGRLGSWWAVVGVGLMCLVSIIAVIFGIVFAFLTGESQPI